MRGMHTLLVVSSVMVGGCGDNIEPSADEQTEILTEDTPGAPPHQEPTAPEITAFLAFSSPSCEAVIGELEIVARYVDGPLLGNPRCKMTFADGSVAFGCIVQHEFESAGVQVVQFEVEDLDTGAIFRGEETGFVSPVVNLTLEATAPACGLEVSYRATADLGGEGQVIVTPADQVIVDNPLYPSIRENTVTVTEPGTYTVTFAFEDERTSGPICNYELVRQVTVTACPKDHEHDPGCGH